MVPSPSVTPSAQSSALPSTQLLLPPGMPPGIPLETSPPPEPPVPAGLSVPVVAGAAGGGVVAVVLTSLLLSSALYFKFLRRSRGKSLIEEGTDTEMTEVVNASELHLAIVIHIKCTNLLLERESEGERQRESKITHRHRSVQTQRQKQTSLSFSLW